MKRTCFHLHLILFISFFLLTGNALFSQEKKNQADSAPVKKTNFIIDIGPELYSGYTQYQIGGSFTDRYGARYKTWFPLSELKFPLNVVMVSGNLKLEILEKIFLHTNIKKNLTGKAGKMKDSDWGIKNNNPDSLDIFSESDAKLDAWIINSDIMFRAIKVSFFSLKAGAGFMYQRFDYDISNIDQWYPSTPAAAHTYISGLGLEYRVTYNIPYFALSPCLNFNDLVKIEPLAAFSPLTTAKDADDHVLRYKKSTGDSKGIAFITSIKVDLLLIPTVFFSANLDYTFIKTKGTQKQVQYQNTWSQTEGFTAAGPIGKIDNQLKSSQLSFGVKAGIRF